MIKDTCIFDFKKGEIKRKDLGKLVETTVRTPSNVYSLENEKQCYMSQIDDSLLWHRRMGYLSLDNLIKVNKKGVVRNFPKIIKATNNVCRHCLHGKQTSDKLQGKRAYNLSAIRNNSH